MEYRALPDSHRDAFRDVASYAFAPETPDFGERDEHRPTLREERAVYDAEPGTPTADLDADAIRAICGYHDFTTRLRGDWYRVGGVSAVASPPESRRQGHVAFMLDELLAEFREAGVAFSVLWPFEYAFYRRFGWALTGPWQELTVPPEDLSGIVADPAGTFRRIDGDDWAAVDRIHRERATEAFAVRRTEEWWRYRVFDPPWSDPYAYGWADDEGTLRAYLVYSVEEEDDGERLAVHRHGYADEHARRQVFRFCRDHDSQVDSVTLSDRRLTDLFETLPDPSAPEVTTRPGPMARIVDVADAVAALSVPEAVEGRVVVAVTDDRCAWNDRTFAFEFGDGEATVEALPDAPAPDLSLDVGSLTQLTTGCIPVDRLRRHDGVTVRDETAAATLAAAYPEETVFLRERF